MKILVTIPHYYCPDNTNHGSGSSNPTPRIEALNECLLHLTALLGNSQFTLNIKDKISTPADLQYSNIIDIVICTANDKHLLDSLKYKPFTHINAKLENPKLLGFECHKVLKQNINKYDYYCFMEDDLIINDSLFFEKLNWINNTLDKTMLLQPNRYEISSKGTVLKAYVDGDINPNVTSKFQNIHDNKYIKFNFLGKKIVLKRPLNPHSGCFFLTNEQLNYWINKDYFLDYDTSFISPLESSASLGIAKTFKLYKPDIQNASFLEIQHYNDAFLNLIGNSIKIIK